MSKEDQSSLLQTAETLKKKLTQRERCMILEVSSRMNGQTNHQKTREESSLKRGNCGI